MSDQHDISSPQPMSLGGSSAPIELHEEFTIISSSTASQNSGMENALEPDNAQNGQLYPENDIVMNYQPTQQLQKTSIQLEYGLELEKTMMIHLERLTCYSDRVSEWFALAKKTRDANERFRAVTKQLKNLLFPHTTRDQFVQGHMEDSAIPLIVDIAENLPLKKNRQRINEMLHSDVAASYSAQVNRGPKSSGGVKKKDFESWGLQSRLQVLNSEAVVKIVENLFIELREIKHNEAKRAKSSPVAAAAQDRILLPEAEDTTIVSLTDWLYHGELRCEGVENLYKLYSTAATLGIRNLVELCLSRMSSSGIQAIHHAETNGYTLCALLKPPEGFTPAMARASAVVVSIFKHTVQDEEAPVQLQSFVINTIVSKPDSEVFKILESKMSRSISLQLNKALIKKIEMEPGQGHQLGGGYIHTENSFQEKVNGGDQMQ